ncbi:MULTISPECIES: sialidase family protein [Actinoalloteichus]|uniref:exo-alpha-sialidase n=1 Tax=Actinoalloteichus fjordicus TaxID=1612552 RepID=A0AAC9LDZ0_9PSEU|nr:MULTISPECIES: sialidase family protein [Actinoalloteichus]APU16093.1 BNR repeat-like domain [Actinoalloteichus fjordicus]APU22158.1 BNR repeat-like domain [Actinoalloteichus sp. GBA129-24]
MARTLLFRTGRRRHSRGVVLALAGALVAAVSTSGAAIAADGPADVPPQPIVAEAAAVAEAEIAAAPSQSARILFNGGNESFNGLTYHSFRIPALIRTNRNTLIAFAEGRAANNRDFGNINLLYKRSTNNGSSWSGLSEVVGRGQGTWGNPTPVVDRTNNRIWLFMNHQPEGSGTVNSWDDRQVWVSSSSDDGVSWTAPVNMSDTLKPRTRANGSSWNWDAVGPGVGIQTTVRNPGRLVIPAQHRNIYSDDHGATWQVEVMRTTGGAAMEQTGESTILELADGSLYRNDRPTTATAERGKRRWVSRGSIESGFSPFAPASCLLDPINEASTMRYNSDAPARLAFVNSASTETRTRMRIRMSEDEGRTWSYSRPFSDAPLSGESSTYREGGYSSIAKTADYHVGALIEVNENTGSNSTSNRSIAFRKVNLPWIQGGVDEPGCSGGL